MSPERELQLHRLLARLRARLGRSRDPQQLARSALREVRDFLGADEACLARQPRGGKVLRFDCRLPASDPGEAG
jgi:hypothetical protein